MKLTVGTKPVFATALVCVRCGRRETHPLDRQNRNVALMVREIEDDNARLTADLAAMTAERDALINVQAQLNGVMCGVRAERDAFKARAEAAERDMGHAISMSPYAICGLFCKNHKPGCGGVNCRPEWRGPAPSNP